MLVRRVNSVDPYRIRDTTPLRTHEQVGTVSVTLTLEPGAGFFIFFLSSV